MHSPTDNAGFKRPPRAPLYGYRWLHCHRHHWRRQFLSTLLPVFSDWHPNITVAALLLPAKLRYRGSQGLRLPSRVRNQRFEDKDFVLAAVNTNGNSLQYASKELKKTKEVVLAAIGNEPAALKFALGDLHQDRLLKSKPPLGQECGDQFSERKGHPVSEVQPERGELPLCHRIRIGHEKGCVPEEIRDFQPQYRVQTNLQ